MADIVLPQMGESVQEGTILKWLKKEGDSIAVDEVLFEVSTDKVDSEVPSPVAGVIEKLLVQEGETVAVGAVIASVRTLEDLPESGNVNEVQKEATSGVNSVEEENLGNSSEGEDCGQSESEENETDDRHDNLKEENTPLSSDPNNAPKEKAYVLVDESGLGGERKVLASPVVRQIARKAGLDIGDIVGTGIGGRITRKDVEVAALDKNKTREGETKKPSGETNVSLVEHKPAQESTHDGVTSEKLQRFNNVRRRTADHMVKSIATSPHAMTAVEVWYDNVDRVRLAEKKGFKEREGFSLTYLPFIARAVVEALGDFPRLNSSVVKDGIELHRNINVSIAVDLNFEGLVAPVIHKAEELRVLGLARAINDVAHRAREKQLSPDDMTGGTFTISNSGSYGTHMVIPIINQPQVAILSTDGISRKPVVVEGVDGSEAIAIRSVGILAMSWDHRAFDGAYAAAFLARLKEILETKDWSVEL